MKDIIAKIKRRAGTIIFAVVGLFIILNPTIFITLGGDAGYRMFTAVWSLIVAHMAMSQMDRHWSHPNDEKAVSLSRFMSKEANNNQKTVIYATLIFSIAVILAAVIVG